MINLNEFWGALEVSIEDITDKETQLGTKICKRLTNKLKKTSDDYFYTIKDEFDDIMGNTPFQIIKELYSKSNNDFLNIYALSVFAEKRIDPQIIYDIAEKKLKSSLAQKAKDQTIDSTALLIPLFKKDPEIIREIYYEHLVQRARFKKYRCAPMLSEPLDSNNIDFEKTEKMLQSYEEKKPKKRRRHVKLWWFSNNEKRIMIVFRREKLARSKLKLVNENMYKKGGDEKIFLFSEGGNVVEMFCRREPNRTLKIAEYFISETLGKKVIFEEVLKQFKGNKVDAFIKRLKNNEIEKATLLGLKVKNIPLANSPILDIQSDESLSPTIDDLADKHNLDILVQSADILGFRIKLDDNAYSLKTKIDSDDVELIFDNRNLRSANKQIIAQFLEKQIG